MVISGQGVRICWQGNTATPLGVAAAGPGGTKPSGANWSKTKPMIPIGPRRLLLLAVTFLVIVASGAFADTAAPNSTPVPPIPPGHARIWIYRDYEPSESLNMTAVSINGAVTGYAQPGGSVFYRDVSPGRYLVSVESYGRDTNQSTNLLLAAGQAVYIKIESLRAWSSVGERTSIERDTFYARPVAPQLARVEMAHIPYYGGG